MYNKSTITIKGNEITYYRINSDVNGNPRYISHFSDLGIELQDYGKIQGLTKYRAKWFGGGYVFQSYSILYDLTRALQLVEAYYKRMLVDTQDEENNKLITLEEGKAFLLTLLDLEEEDDEWQKVQNIADWDDLEERLMPFEYCVDEI